MFPADLIPPSRYWLPLTYPPKIPGVQAGTIRQTIQVAGKTVYHVGDLVAFHGWAGKPYRSPWSFRTEYFELKIVQDIIVFPTGIQYTGADWLKDFGILPWDHARLEYLATLDGIVPATGLELGRVLCGYNEIPEGGVAAFILRW